MGEEHGATSVTGVATFLVGAVVTILAGSVGGALVAARAGHARYWVEREDQLIPAAWEFAAATLRLVAFERASGRSAPVPDHVGWRPAYEALVPFEHDLPNAARDVLNDPEVSSPDDAARWAALERVAGALKDDCRARSRRRRARVHPVAWWRR